MLSQDLHDNICPKDGNVVPILTYKTLLYDLTYRGWCNFSFEVTSFRDQL